MRRLLYVILRNQSLTADYSPNIARADTLCGARDCTLNRQGGTVVKEESTDVAISSNRVRRWVVGTATTLGLPALVTALLKGFAKDHPALLVAGFAVYATVLVVAAFLWRTVKGEVNHWIQRQADGISIMAGRVLSRYDRLYRHQLRNRLKQIGSTGAAEIDSSRLLFEDVYVQIHIAERRPINIPSDALSAESLLNTRRLRILDILNENKVRVLVVLGAAGMGKTSLSHYLAHELTSSSKKSGHSLGRKEGQLKNLRGVIPILITLPDCAPQILGGDSLSLARLGSLGGREIEGCQKWLEAQLAKGNCLVIMDGLDEVADVRSRREIISWIEKSPAWKNYENRFVFTCRPDTYLSSPVSQVDLVAQVMPLTGDQVAAFTRKRFLAMLRSESQRHADRFLKQIQDHDLHDLAVNPLLLTMMISLYRTLLDVSLDPRLPESRVDLYREICDVLLCRRVSPGLDPAQKRTALTSLAFAMMANRELSSTIPTLSPQIGAGDLEGPARALKSDGLVTLTAGGAVSFTHKTFQEYLAAVHIHENHLVHTLMAHVREDPDWWRGCVLFLAWMKHDTGQEESAVLVDEFLRAPSRQSAELFAEISLFSLIRRRTPQLVSAKVFLIFAECTKNDTNFPLPDAPYPSNLDEPVRGVRGGDAVRFVAWANSVLGPSSKYRLPTVAELDQLANGDLAPANMRRAWLNSEFGLPTRWVRSGTMSTVDRPDRLVLDEVTNMVIRSLSANTDQIASELHDDSVRAYFPILAIVHFIDAELARRIAIRVGQLDNRLQASINFRLDSYCINALVIAAALDPEFVKAGTDVLSGNEMDDLVQGIACELSKARAGSISDVKDENNVLLVSEELRKKGNPLEPCFILEVALTYGRDDPFNAVQIVILARLLARASGAETVVGIHDSPDGPSDNLVKAELMADRVHGLSRWETDLLRELISIATPVFRRDRQITPKLAAKIRHLAVYLAQKSSHEAISSRLRKIAIDATLLERRFCVEAQPDELIVLTADDWGN
ncbi:NACHT domain-containing protein [Nocardia sp. NPDC059228]|uniref:NACHT domain-containing protein n=1 Tax=Nocardia sp. NPDC059228 TaxID=3346777 RepID=UPI0036AC1050